MSFLTHEPNFQVLRLFVKHKKLKAQRCLVCFHHVWIARMKAVFVQAIHCLLGACTTVIYAQPTERKPAKLELKMCHNFVGRVACDCGECAGLVATGVLCGQHSLPSFVKQCSALTLVPDKPCFASNPHHF